MNHLIAVIGIVCIGFSPIWVSLADVSPATAAFFRATYALPALTLIWLVGRSRDPRPTRARALAVASGFLLALDLTVWHQSIEYIGAGLSTILGNTQAVFVAVLAWLVHRERPSASALQMIPVILLGAAFISGFGQRDAYGEAPVAGALLGLASAVLYALFLLTFRASNRALAKPAGPLLDATLGASVATLVFSGVDPGFSLAWSWPGHGYLIALALGSQVTGWLMITYALPRLAALETSLLLPLQPMVSLVVGALWLGERISRLQGIGIALVLGGIVYASIKGATRPAGDGQSSVPDITARADETARASVRS